MGTALMIVNFLSAAATAGMNIVPLLGEISALIDKRRAEGKTLTKDDLLDLFTEGDDLELEAREQFESTLADPNTPSA